MITVGIYNHLKAVRQTDNGIYFMDEKETMEALLPNKFLPDEMDEGEYMDLFVFKDHLNRLTATTQEPKILLHQFAYLRVREVSQVGAFLDWGLDKDLFVPFKEQPADMVEGNSYMVFLYLDPETERLVATGRYMRHLDKKVVALSPHEAVELLIDDRTDLGFNVIINHRYRGLLYENEIFQPLRRGEARQGFVKSIREDGKIDLTLQRPGYATVEANAQRILDYLQSHKGYLPLTDKTDPEEVYNLLNISKKVFKKALGGLYKQRLVKLEKDGVYLVKGA